MPEFATFLGRDADAPSAAGKQEKTVACVEPPPSDLLAFMPLVRTIAYRIYSSIPSYAAVDLNDLIQSGHLGLLNASRAYRKSKRVPFSVYARFRIRGEILDSLRQIDAASRGLRRWEKRMRAARQSLTALLGREPTDMEVGAMLELSVEEFSQKRQALQAASMPTAAMVSLEEKVRAEAAWISCDPDPETLRAKSEASELLSVVMDKLPARSRSIIHMYYVQGRTMREIANHFRVNESRISQIHRTALDRMARSLRASGIHSAEQL